MFKYQHDSRRLRILCLLTLLVANQFSFADRIAAQERPAADANPNQEPLENPFVRRISIPDFPKDMQWLNTSKPLTKQDLKGKFVVLDFWTYCCINCIHILPELKKLEKAYPNELVVIGVHSAKFEAEKKTKNIEEAILRYEIEHPVINDAEHRVWDSFGIQSWPTVLMIDPEGKAVWGTGGEIEFKTVDAVLKAAIPYYAQQGTLDRTPMKFDLLADQQDPTPLRFPGKVLADEASNRLFIADSNHNRIVVASLDGNLLDTIGSGAIGRDDGNYDKASFDHLQGMAIDGETLYVADTENHLLRKVDLKSKLVTTIAGTGAQRRSAWPGMENLDLTGALPQRFVGEPLETAINSPWALWVHKDALYIAMAGPHQIWKMLLDGSEIGPYAGNGREDIVDGPLLPPVPYQEGYSSFAQPSGLASDGEWLFVADSEGSSIRAVPFDLKREVRTIVGTSKLAGGRLFAFGDVDGEQPLATYALDDTGNVLRDPTGYPIIQGVRLQHALGVAYHDGKIYVTDTYNNKIKAVDAKTGATRTIAGTGEPGISDAPAQFDEPAGITYANGTLYIADTNNHLIRTLTLATGSVGRFEVQGLKVPAQ
ncbi:MAG: thioredoxin-like domain-containing protein [Planctomycetota bacterium]|nr:thioredoxin-like domain-containing protein [Planctomycetota bacterium]